MHSHNLPILHFPLGKMQITHRGAAQQGECTPVGHSGHQCLRGTESVPHGLPAAPRSPLPGTAPPGSPGHPQNCPHLKDGVSRAGHCSLCSLSSWPTGPRELHPPPGVHPGEEEGGTWWVGTTWETQACTSLKPWAGILWMEVCPAPNKRAYTGVPSPSISEWGLTGRQGL